MNLGYTKGIISIGLISGETKDTLSCLHPPRSNACLDSCLTLQLLIHCSPECTNLTLYSTLLIMYMFLLSFYLYLHIIITGINRQPMARISRIETQSRRSADVYPGAYTTSPCCNTCLRKY